MLNEYNKQQQMMMQQQIQKIKIRQIKIMFYYNAIKIDRNEPKTVEEFFNFYVLADIHVLGC